MSYSEFTLDKVRKAFDLTIIDKGKKILESKYYV